VDLLAPIVAATVCFLLLHWARRWRDAPLDRPNDRSLHAAPVARIGGLAVVPGIAAGWLLVPEAVPWPVWGPLAWVFVISYLDDANGAPVIVRLLAHVVAAVIASVALVLPAAGWATATIAMLAIVWSTNLYNFMDGSDGLAGGMAVIGFTAYAIAAGVAGAPALALTCLVVAASSAVFLFYNFHPASVFLGDAGSVPMGFLVAALGALGWTSGAWPAWFPVFVFSPFIVDASATLARRAWRRERIWRAHKEHYYQRLVRLGWGHRRTALAEYGAMLICGAAALLGLHLPAAGQSMLLAIAAMSYLALMYAIDQAWSQNEELCK
jgi:UDP-N-acetylmuramyl pentapeptide phosphotransferase/UDP-N-acetylglucosamine-1-phosphate transferase